MSQFMGLFRTAACAQLDKLLNLEFPNTNVPMILRNFDQPPDLESAYMYVAVVYRRHVEAMAPRFFRNPLDATSDGQTFTEVSLFIPQRRHVCCPWSWPQTRYDQFGNPYTVWIENMEGLSHEWSTFNQNWTAKLVPATAEVIPDILATNPGGPAGGVRTPTTLRGRSMREFHPINTH